MAPGTNQGLSKHLLDEHLDLLEGGDYVRKDETLPGTTLHGLGNRRKRLGEAR